ASPEGRPVPAAHFEHYPAAQSAGKRPEARRRRRSERRARQGAAWRREPRSPGAAGPPDRGGGAIRASGGGDRRAWGSGREGAPAARRTAEAGGAWAQGAGGPALGRVRHPREGGTRTAQGQDRGGVRVTGRPGADRQGDAPRLECSVAERLSIPRPRFHVEHHREVPRGTSSVSVGATSPASRYARASGPADRRRERVDVLLR